MHSLICNSLLKFFEFKFGEETAKMFLFLEILGIFEAYVGICCIALVIKANVCFGQAELHHLSIVNLRQIQNLFVAYFTFINLIFLLFVSFVIISCRSFLLEQQSFSCLFLLQFLLEFVSLQLFINFSQELGRTHTEQVF